MTTTEGKRPRTLLELLGDARTREIERYHAARYGKPSFLERILTKCARK